MKLAEALILRADMQSRLQQLETRLINNATVQEGEVSVEAPDVLLGEFDSILTEIGALITRINITNTQTKKDTRSMTELLAERDCLKIRLKTYRHLLYTASNITSRMRGSEIKIKSNIDVAELQKVTDGISEQLRKLETTIQEINWTTDLV